MDKIDQLVAQWNHEYLGMADRKLMDLSPEAYEAEVGYAMFEVGGSWENALAIFNHKNNEGGWMSGDVEKFIKCKMKKA